MFDHALRLECIRLRAVCTEEVAERRPDAVDAGELVPVARVRDDLDARAGERAQPADVVPVRVRHDHLADRQIDPRPDGGERSSRGRRCRAGVDGDQALRRRHEGEVGEVISASDVDPLRRLADFGGTEPVPVLLRDGSVGRVRHPDAVAVHHEAAGRTAVRDQTDNAIPARIDHRERVRLGDASTHARRSVRAGCT